MTEEMKDQEMDESEEIKAEEAEAAENVDTEEAETACESEAEEEAEEQEPDGAGESEEAEDGKTQEAAKGKEKKERKLGWTKKAKEEAKKAEEEKVQAQIAEANDRYTRLFAEFDNFRKRTDKEKSQMFAMGARDVVEKILPIVDSFERGLGTVPEDKKEDSFVVGMDKVYKQFMQILEGMGVTPIEAVGKEFDPNFHNAVMHVDDESVGENIVVEEFQKGYMYKESLLRPSMVKVAN